MKRTAKLLGLALVMLSLWGCGGQPQSETSTQNEAAVQEAQATKESTTTQTPVGRRPFITKWKGEAGKSIEIPALGTYTLTWYNEATPNERHTEQVTVKTEKVGSGEYVRNEIRPYILKCPTDGVYVLELGPEGVESFTTWRSEHENTERLLSVVQFGDVVWKTFESAFHACVNMRFEEGIDSPNLSQCTSLSGMFTYCKNFNSPLEHWDVSNVTDMGAMFHVCNSFNQPLNGWNVGKVTNMMYMFAECEKFNQPLDKWDVSNVTDMNAMFYACTSFNQPLEKWNVRNVTEMSGMFSECDSFNQPLEKWDVSKVKNMSNMFMECKAFNQSLEAWDISDLPKEDGMKGIFYKCPAGELPFVKKWEAAGYDLEPNDDIFA